MSPLVFAVSAFWIALAILIGIAANDAIELFGAWLRHRRIGR